MRTIALRITRSCFVLIVVATTVLLSAPAEVPAQDRPGVSPVVDADPVLRTIAEADRALPEQFAAVFEMRRSAYPVPEQPAGINRCVLTTGDRVTVLAIESQLSGDPVFRPPSTSGYQQADFDEFGNLILWRSLEKSAISTSKLNRVHDNQEKVVLSPNGTIVERTMHRQVYVYPVGSPDSMYEAAQMGMIAGRGYSKRLSAFESQRMNTGGLWEVVAAGTFGPALSGTWTLEMDSREKRLVRIATFRPHGQVEPAVRVVTEGEIKVGRGLHLASSGTLEFGRGDRESRVEVRLIEFRPGPPDPSRVRNLKEQLGGAIADGTEVIDYSGYEPRRYVVGGGNGR